MNNPDARANRGTSKSKPKLRFCYVYVGDEGPFAAVKDFRDDLSDSVAIEKCLRSEQKIFVDPMRSTLDAR